MLPSYRLLEICLARKKSGSSQSGSIVGERTRLKLMSDAAGSSKRGRGGYKWVIRTRRCKNAIAGSLERGLRRIHISNLCDDTWIKSRRLCSQERILNLVGHVMVG